MALFAHEWLTLGYAAGWLLIAAVSTVQRRRTAWPATVVAGALVVLVLLAARYLPLAGRLSLGLVYLPVGYWLPALIRSRGVHPAFARWLERSDRQVLHAIARLPRPVVHLADICYLLCYPLVPAGFLTLVWLGTTADQQRFWVAVLAAGFACYATLPWLVTLPPRRLGRQPIAERGVHVLNVALLERVSHGFNTFPSGHAAVSVAVALATIAVPVASMLFAGLAAGVALGAVVGRHHYTVDVLIGILVGLVATIVGFAAA